jgi:hypothetical protein
VDYLSRLKHSIPVTGSEGEMNQALESERREAFIDSLMLTLKKPEQIQPTVMHASTHEDYSNIHESVKQFAGKVGHPGKGMFNRMLRHCIIFMHLVVWFMHPVKYFVTFIVDISGQGLDEDEESQALFLKYEERLKRKSWKVSILLENIFLECLACKAYPLLKITML